MRTFWNLNREFETQIDLVTNKWFANFESKATGKCVPCGPWIIFELNTKCASFWNKWFANFEPKAKAKWVPCGAWISFQLSPKMQEKATVLERELRTFGLIYSCCVQNHFRHLTQNSIWSVFFVKFAQLSFAKFYIALCKLIGQIFSGFLHRLIKR